MRSGVAPWWRDPAVLFQEQASNTPQLYNERDGLHRCEPVRGNNMNDRLSTQIIREIRIAAREAPALYFAPIRKALELWRTVRSGGRKQAG